MKGSTVRKQMTAGCELELNRLACSQQHCIFIWSAEWYDSMAVQRVNTESPTDLDRSPCSLNTNAWVSGRVRLQLNPHLCWCNCHYLTSFPLLSATAKLPIPPLFCLLSKLCWSLNKPPHLNLSFPFSVIQSTPSPCPVSMLKGHCHMEMSFCTKVSPLPMMHPWI